MAGRSLATFVLLGLLGLALVLAHRHSRSRDGDYRYWRRTVLALGAIGLTLFVRSLLVHQIIIVDTAFYIVDLSLFVITYLLAAVLVLNLGNALAAAIIKSRSINPNWIDA